MLVNIDEAMDLSSLTRFGPAPQGHGAENQSGCRHLLRRVLPSKRLFVGLKLPSKLQDGDVAAPTEDLLREACARCGCRRFLYRCGASVSSTRAESILISLFFELHWRIQDAVLYEGLEAIPNRAKNIMALPDNISQRVLI